MFVEVPMSFPSRLSLRAAALLVAVVACVLGGVSGAGRVIELDWTPEGVRQFNSISSPLRTELGDELRLRCGQTYSNLFIQTEQIQFDNCNALSGSRRFSYNGFCPPGDTLILTLSRNSQALTNGVNFNNNTAVYFTSYSNGQLSGASNASRTSGGECLDGVRIVVAIGDVPPPTSTPGTVTPTPPPIPPTQDPAGVVDNGDNGDRHIELLYIVVPAAAGSLIIIVLAVIFSIFVIKVCYIKSKKIHHNDPLSHQEIPCVINAPNQDKGFYQLVPSSDKSSPSTSPRHSLGLITTRSSGVQPNFYVDSLRLPSPRPSSRYSDHGSHVSRNDATVTVLRQSPSPADTYASTTTTFNTVLPMATRSGRRPAPQAPQVQEYQNVDESDLPPFVQKRDSREGKRAPVTYRRPEAWKEV